MCMCVCAHTHLYLLSLVWLFVKHKLYPTRLLCPWDFPVKNTGVDCHFLLQGIFLTQGLNPCLLNWQEGCLPPSHQGSPHVGQFIWKDKWTIACSIWANYNIIGLPWCLAGKNLPAMQEITVRFLRKIHWSRDRLPTLVLLNFPDVSTGKESACNVEDLDLIPGLEWCPGEGKGNPL